MSSFEIFFFKLIKLFFPQVDYFVIILSVVRVLISFNGRHIWFFRRFFVCLVIVVVTAVCNYANVYADSQENVINSPADEYSLRLIPDIIMLGSSAGLFLTGKIVQSSKPAVTPEEINSLKRDNIFELDRLFMCDFSKGYDLASGITEYSSLAMPLLPAAGAVFNSNYKQVFSIVVEYSESLMYSLGTKNLLKGLIKRFRPYAYYSEAGGYFEPSYLINENPETAMSFPSGHTTAAFTGAVFVGMMFNRYYPDSPLRLPVWITALTAASATGILRVMSGNHYVTDVISGAVIGSFFGFIVPFIHDFN